MPFFVWKGIKSGRCEALNQHLTSLIVDDIGVQHYLSRNRHKM